MTDNLSPELSYVLNICKNIYQPLESSTNLSETKIQNIEELSKVIRLAKDNALVYHITESDPSLLKSARADPAVEHSIDEARATYDDYLGRLKGTLSDINGILGERTFLLMKTVYGYPRTTKDVDILVSDVPATMNNFLAKGYSHRFTEPPYKETVIRKGGLSVTLHECVAWKRVVPMDVKFLWESPRDIVFHGMNLRLVNAEADLITLIAHIPFESMYFNLGDVLYMFALSQLADWQKIIAQAKANSWEGTLNNIVSILNGLHRSMYGSPSPIEKVIPSHRDVKAEFPLRCPLLIILKAHIEKRAWEKIFSLGNYVRKRSKIPKYVETYP